MSVADLCRSVGAGHEGAVLGRISDWLCAVRS
jgi:hypothetical protein